MDRLAPFFEKFSLTARMFYSGLLCGSSGDQVSEHAGHLHVLKKGRLKITRPDARQIVIDTPSILFFPRPRLHRLHGPVQEGAELVCATIEFGAGMLNPLIASLPEPMDRLFEYLFVLLIRSAMGARLIDSGILMGLSDSRLSRAIEAMHQHPETLWSLEHLAQFAGMSRASFAVHFREIVGMRPFDYLTDWRLGVAQTMLQRQLAETDRIRGGIRKCYGSNASL